MHNGHRPRLVALLIALALLAFTCAAHAQDGTTPAEPAEPVEPASDDAAVDGGDDAETIDDGGEPAPGDPNDDTPPADGDAGAGDEVREILETQVEDPTEAARLLYDEAVLHYQAGDFQAAARALIAAYEIDPDPVLAFNAARAWDDAGNLEQARKWYLLALSESELGENERKRAVKAIERLDNTEQALKTRVDSLKLTESRVQVTSTQAGSVVYINGEAVGETPFAGPVEPGTYTIRVEAPGHESFSQLVEVVEGQTLVVRAALERDSLMPWVYTLGGVTIVALGVGIAGDVLAVERYDSAEASRAGSNFDDLVAEGEGFQTMAIVGYSLAGVAGVTTLVLGLVEGLSGPQSEGYRTLGDLMGVPVDLGVGPTGASMTLTW